LLIDRPIDERPYGAGRWVNAINQPGQHGSWHYLLVTDPGALGVLLNAYTTAKWNEGQLELV
jgi:type III restriction enzyme